jgi:hypothetical protein
MWAVVPLRRRKRMRMRKRKKESPEYSIFVDTKNRGIKIRKKCRK